MCNLDQESGLGKVVSKVSNKLHTESIGGQVADKTKRLVHGDEYVDQGGHKSLLFSNYRSEAEKERDTLLDSAPAFGTAEYTQWYEKNRQSLLS